jgi:hypothetical protein
MKLLPFLFILFSCKLLSQAPVDTTKRPYRIKYCKISFTFNNGPQKGTKTLIFDDWGNYEKVYGITETDTAFVRSMMKGSSLPMLDLGEKQSELIINTPTAVFKINLVEKKGGKTAKKNDEQSRLLNEMVSSVMQKQVVGYETYLGKNCSVEVIKDFMKMWFWNGICLKKEFLNGKELELVEYATEIDESYVPAQSEFEPPRDIEIKEY